MAKILALWGSVRDGSVNERLLRAAVAYGQEKGAEITTIDLRDYTLPLFGEDLEKREGIPLAAKKLKKLCMEHEGLLIASPEYNSAFSPLLKNTFDWISRQENDEKPLAAFKGKVAALLSASPGSLGGMRGLVFLRMFLGNVGVVVIPEQFSLTVDGDTFDESGTITDDAKGRSMRKVVRSLIKKSALLFP